MKILLTEGSSTSARQILYALGSAHAIDVLDPNAWCQARFSKYVRHWYRCPRWSRDPLGYLGVLFQRLRAERYDVLLPTHEQVFLIARVRDQIEPLVGLAVPSFESVDRLMSKAAFVRLLDEVGLPQPSATIVRTRRGLLQEQTYPCWVKLDYSTAGQGVRLVRNRDEMEIVVEEFDRAGWLAGENEIVVQRPAVGVKGSINAVFDHGRLVAFSCMEARALGVGGSSMAQVSVERPIEVEHVRRLGEYLKWHGPLVLELCFDAESGRPEYLECNPRIGETVNGWLAGANLPQHWLRVALNQSPPCLTGNRSGVLSHQGFLILMARALEGGGRRQLLRELWRSCWGDGLYADSQDELSRPYDDWLSALPFLGIALLLLALPRAAQAVVRSTVKNYCLHGDAAKHIRELPSDQVERLFAANELSQAASAVNAA